MHAHTIVIEDGTIEVLLAILTRVSISFKWLYHLVYLLLLLVLAIAVDK